MSIKSSVESLGPDEASSILAASKDVIRNRHVTECHVNWLADQIRSGKWKTNGEPIILDQAGILLDGQHRLHAILVANTTIETVVTRGVERSTFATIDTGNKRTSGDVLSIAGEQNAVLLGCVLGWIYRYEAGGMLNSLKASGFSSPIALTTLRRHPTVREDVQWATTEGKRNVFLGRVAISTVAMLRYIFGQHKPNLAVEFFDLVGDLRQDESGTPTRVLRDWIVRDSASRTKANPLEVMAIIVKAWTAFLNGEKPKTYIWRRSTAYPESFPKFPGDKESRGVAIRGMERKDGRKKKKSDPEGDAPCLM